MAVHKVEISLTREDVYDLCDALTSEAERFETLLSRRLEAPEASRKEWERRIAATRELSRRLISECFAIKEAAQ